MTHTNGNLVTLTPIFHLVNFFYQKSYLLQPIGHYSHAIVHNIQRCWSHSIGRRWENRLLRIGAACHRANPMEWHVHYKCIWNTDRSTCCGNWKQCTIHLWRIETEIVSNFWFRCSRVVGSGWWTCPRVTRSICHSRYERWTFNCKLTHKLLRVLIITSYHFTALQIYFRTFFAVSVCIVQKHFRWSEW